MTTEQTTIANKSTGDSLTAVEFNELNTNFNKAVTDIATIEESIQTLSGNKVSISNSSLSTIFVLTQVEYDAISEKDATTLYFIK